jgi:hypothetical protein
MNLEHIRDRLSNGFKPFRMELSNGRRLAVPHPEFIIVGPDAVGLLSKHGVVTTVDALHIVSIADLPPKRK